MLRQSKGGWNINSQKIVLTNGGGIIHIYNEEFELAQEQLEITSKISQKNFIESYIITNKLE